MIDSLISSPKAYNTVEYAHFKCTVPLQAVLTLHTTPSFQIIRRISLNLQSPSVVRELSRITLRTHMQSTSFKLLSHASTRRIQATIHCRYPPKPYHGAHVGRELHDGSARRDQALSLCLPAIRAPARQWPLSHHSGSSSFQTPSCCGSALRVCASLRV